MMRRRWLVAAGLMGWAQPVVAREAAETFVVAMCRRAAEPPRPDEPGLPLSPRVLELQRKLRDSPHPAVGPTLDLFFGPGILPNAPIEVGKARIVQQSGQEALVAIDLIIKGTPQTHSFALVGSGDDWLIDNITYADTDYVSWMEDRIRRSR